jgi:hypothetical protein
VTPAALCLAIALLWPDVPRDRACAAADAIVAVATPEYPAELLAAIAYGESKFQLGLVGKRGEVGAWQVKLYGANRGARRRAALTTYEAGVAEAIGALTEATRICKSRLRANRYCVLAVYRGGPKAWRARSGPMKVLARAEAIRKAAGHAPARRVGS